MARQVEVISGLRGGPQHATAAPEASTVVKTAGEGEVVYESRAANYRLQLIAADDIYNALTGHRERGRTLHAQFRFGFFRTKDPEVIKLMESKKDYGLGKDFWRQKDAAAAALKNNADKFISQLESIDVSQLDPATRSRLAAVLGPDVKSEFVPAP